MSSVKKSGTCLLGNRQVNRLGYGAMQLAGPGVFGPPKDPETAVKVLQAAVEAGVNHIDTSDFYGPHITNQLIRKALYPYPADLCIVTKVSARRDEKGGWIPAMSPAELTQAVEDNLRNLGLETLEVVNLRSMLGIHGPVEGSLEEPLTALIKLKERGLIRHIGISNVTAKQVAEAQKLTQIACVQNFYNLANRQDDALIDQLAAQNIPYVPFFPLGGFSPLQSQELNEVAATLDATPMQVALAWLLQRSPNILLIPGTSSLGHLEENLAAANLTLSAEVVTQLDNIKPA
jgi:aryl-alcohol dehydrogenase-like predicted oxidoreductase